MTTNTTKRGGKDSALGVLERYMNQPVEVVEMSDTGVEQGANLRAHIQEETSTGK